MPRIVRTPDGATLQLREWPGVEDPWARLLIVHGIAEHGGRYDRTATQLAEAGIDVTAVDLRGHGGSSGRRGDLERWSDLTGDIGRLMATLRSTTPVHPTVLLGHSMGGLLALDAVLQGAAVPDLLVLSSPALGDALPRWLHLVAPPLARVAPTLMVRNAWGPDALSRDPDVGRRVAADPACLTHASVRTGALGFAAQVRVAAALGGLHVPTLVTHGDADPLVPAATTERLGAQPGVTRVVHPGLRHEPYNEPEGRQVVAGVIAWLRAEVSRARAPSPSG